VDCYTVVIGSSPVSLMNAFMRQKAGEKVKIIERDSEIGGVWKTGIAFGIAGLETTPHFFMPDEKGYAALRRLLPHDYEPFGAPAYMHIVNSPSLGTRRVPIDNSYQFHACLLAKSHLDSTVNNRWKRSYGYAKDVIKLKASSFIRPSRTEPLYPVGGMTGWLTALEQHASSLGIAIDKGRRIVAVKETSDGIEIIDDNGRSEAARHLVLSGKTMLEQIELLNGRIAVEPVEIESHHYTFAIANQPPSGLEHFIGHPELFLVNDVTRFAPPLFAAEYPEHRLIVARTVYTSEYSPNAANVIDALKKAGYLSADARVEADSHWHLRQRFLHRKSLRALRKRMPKKISLLSAGDLDIVNAAARMRLAKTRW
jgi:hypothetical protein